MPALEPLADVASPIMIAHLPKSRLAAALVLMLATAGSVAACSDSSASPETSGTTADTEVVTPTTDTTPPATAAPDTAAPDTSVVTTTAPDVVTIDPDGIGEAKLGDEPEGVIGYFTTLFGAPVSDSGWVDGGSCDAPTLRIVQWANLYTTFAPWDALGAGVAGPEQFVFFSYGITNDVYPTDPLATDRGLLVGDTVEQLLALYPEATVYDGSLGGRFYRFSDDIVGPNGILLNSAPEIVSSIEAGDWPCANVR